MMRNFLLLSAISFTAAAPPVWQVKLTQAALQEHDLTTRSDQSKRKAVDIGIDSEKLRKFEQYSNDLIASTLEIEVKGLKRSVFTLKDFPMVQALNLDGTKTRDGKNKTYLRRRWHAL